MPDAECDTTALPAGDAAAAIDKFLATGGSDCAHFVAVVRTDDNAAAEMSLVDAAAYLHAHEQR